MMPRAAAVLAASAVTLSWAAAPPEFNAADRRVVSLTEVGGLGQQGLFDISFEKDRTGGIRLVWIASASGLHSYDGYRWRRYGVKNGLPSEFVRCVLASRTGELWVGTDQGAGVFNGTAFDPRDSGRGLAGPNVRRIIEDREGAIWFTSDSWPNAKVRGGIARLRDGQWRAWRTEDGLPSDYVVNQYTDSAGRKFAMTLGGPARLNGERWVAERTPPLSAGAHWGSAVMTEAPGLGPVLSNGDDVLRLDGKGEWQRLGSPPRHRHGVTAVDGRIMVAGDAGRARKAIFEWSGSGWRQVSDEFSVPRSYGEALRLAPDGSVWYLGFDCLVRWRQRGSEWRTLAPAPGPIFADGEGAVWAHLDWQVPGLPGGLFELRPEGWVRRGPRNEHGFDQQKGIWTVEDTRVVRWTEGKAAAWAEAETGVRHFLNVAVDGDGIVWAVGRDRQGLGALAAYNGRTWRKFGNPGLGRLTGLEQAALRQSGGGVWYLVRASTGGPFRLFLATMTGIESVPIPEQLVISPFTTELAADQHGNLWIYRGTGPYRLGADRKWTSYSDLPARRVRSVGFQGDQTWLLLDAALGGKSGMLLMGRDGERQFFERDISAGFSQTPDGTLISGGKSAIHVIPPQPGSPPFEIQLDVRDPVNSAFRDRQGVYWISTAAQLSQFRPDGVPPDTGLVVPANAVLAGQPFAASATARERFQPSGEYPWFSFSWRIDSGAWSPFVNSTSLQLPARQLSLGKHRVAVRARDNGQDIDPSPAEATFEVHPLPLQERPWFLPALLTVVGLLALATSAALNARRKVAAQAGELEKRVEERTASLVEEVSRRGRVETELRASDQRYREMVDAAQEGIATFDPNGHCIQANRELARIFGKPLEEILGRHLRDSIDADAYAVVARASQDRGREAALTYDLTIRPEGQEPRHVSVCKKPWCDEGGRECCLMTVTDMTEQKKAEEAIRRSEAYYRLLFESNPNAMYVIDLDTFQFLSVNQAMCDVYGYRQAELSRMAVLELEVAETAGEAKGRLALSLATPTRWAWRHRRKDGSPIEVDITAQDLEFQGRRARLFLAVDTTARNRAASALQESEANLARAQRIAHLGSFQWPLGPDPAPCIWSDEVYRILGLTKKEHSNLTLAGFFELVHPDDRPGLQAAQASAVEMMMQPVECEHRVERPDGTVRHVRTTLVVTTTSGGEALAGTLQDITEYRLLEEQFRQSQKLESIGRLAGGVAHDFNNLLTVINGYSGRILQRLDPNGGLHSEAAQVVQAGKEAAALTRQLLTFSRKQMFRPEAVDLNEEIARITQMLKTMAGEEIELVTQLHFKPVVVLVDPTQLQQVLLNLSVNARDAMPHGGTLTISTSLITLDDRFAAAHPGARSRPAALLEVADTGVGMTADTQRRIFEPFFTTKDRTGGTGLGLATVYGIVQQSGGVIEVESEPGQGARFRVYFLRLAAAPREAASAVTESGQPGGAVAARGRGETVLLVEDQRDVREFAASVLRTAGYKVLEAANGRDALDLSDARIAALDLVVTDMIMPGMTGRDLASALQARRGPGQCLPVLFVSGYTADTIGSGGPKLELLEKPFTAEVLLGRVRQLLGPVAVVEAAAGKLPV